MDGIQLALEIAKLLTTVIAAGVAAFVAWKIGSSQRDIAKRQAETASAAKEVAHAKLNLDLFEQRYAVFETVWWFLSGVVQDPMKEITDPLFTNEIPKAQFLFGKPIADFMRQASTKQTELQILERKMASVTYQLVETENLRVLELQTWFYDEANNCFKRFGDYLDFSSWKADPLGRLFNVNAA